MKPVRSEVRNMSSYVGVEVFFFFDSHMCIEMRSSRSTRNQSAVLKMTIVPLR